MRSVRVLFRCPLVGAALVFIFVLVSRGDEPMRSVWYPADRVIPMPYYPGIALLTGVSGTARFRLDFKAGRISSIELIESDLTVKKPPSVPDRKKYAQLIIDGVLDRQKQTLNKWSSPFTDEFSQEVEIRLVLDDRLKPNERHFRVTLGSEGIPSHIDVVGPGK